MLRESTYIWIILRSLSLRGHYIPTHISSELMDQSTAISLLSGNNKVFVRQTIPRQMLANMTAEVRIGASV